MRTALTLIVLLLFSQARADVVFEAGPTFLSGEYSDGFIIIVADRITPNYEISINYAYKQVCRCTWPADLEENLGVTAMRVGTWGRFELGLGIAYWQNTNRAFGKNFNAHGMLGWRIGDRATVRIRHWSNTGSGVPNLGQDLVSLAWSF